MKYASFTGPEWPPVGRTGRSATNNGQHGMAWPANVAVKAVCAWAWNIQVTATQPSPNQGAASRNRTRAPAPWPPG